MADITLSPIPYNGGTLAMSVANSHICHLGGGKFFVLFGQSNPNYVFAAVINVTNLKSGTPTAVIPKQRIMAQQAPTRLRVWKLASNRVLALLNGDLVVFEVTEDDDIVQKGASIPAFHTTFLWGADAVTAYSNTSGSQIQGQYVKENHVWMGRRATTTGPVVLEQIIYNPETDKLTVNELINFSTTMTATHFTRFHVQPFPNSDRWLAYLRGPTTTTMLGSQISQFHIMNDEGAIETSVLSDNMPTAVRCLVPLSPTRILGLTDPRSYRVFDGTVWTQADTVFASGVVANTNVIEAEPIDPDYFFVCSTTTNHELASATATYGFRVSRFVDAVFGQTSAATSASNGIAYQIANAYFDQRIMHKVDHEAYVMFGRATATQFRIRVLYQPAA